MGTLGGIGASGVGSYGPTELNEEVAPEKNVKTFKDVKGCDDAKQELEEVVEYLKNPSKFTRLGGKLPKGILLTGAPGTGKTLLAKAIAGEAGVLFFYKAGSEFEEVYVGVGARRVRSLFQAARKKAPCIIFIDEIDAIGSTRKQFGGYTKKTLNQLLVEMDGFEHTEGIIVMAATNLPDILDPALTRPGRFDRHIAVSKPDMRGRQEILELYLQDKPLEDGLDVKEIARGTPGFNGADLANLVNIAAIKAAVEGADKINAAQLEFAKDRITMGTERKTLFISEESKKLTAYHESGHAIAAFNTEGAHPVHKATIMPHGSALGMVTLLPSGDERSISKRQLLARLDVCMGGRAAEELIFGKDQVTTGASRDLQTATELAKYMVSGCGMSDAIGPVHIKGPQSATMQSRIDAEVGKLLREAYGRVISLLKKHEKALHALANALLEYETLSAEDIKRVLLPYCEGRLPQQQEDQVMDSTHHQPKMAEDPLAKMIADGRVNVHPIYGLPEILTIDLELLRHTLVFNLTQMFLYNNRLRNAYSGSSITVTDHITEDTGAYVDYLVGHTYNKLRSTLKKKHSAALVQRMNKCAPVPPNQEFPTWLSSTLSCIGPLRNTCYASSAATMANYGRTNPVCFNYGAYSRLQSALVRVGVRMTPFDDRAGDSASYYPTIQPHISQDQNVCSAYGAVHSSHYENEDFARIYLLTSQLGHTPFEKVGMRIGYVDEAAAVDALAAIAAAPPGIPAGQTAESPGLPAAAGHGFRVNYFGIQPAVPAAGDNPGKRRGMYVIGRGNGRYYPCLIANNVSLSEIWLLLYHRIFNHA